VRRGSQFDNLGFAIIADFTGEEQSNHVYLENTDIIVTAHPLIYGIPNTFYCLTEEEQAAASQGELSESAMRRKESDMEGKEYKKVWTKSFFVGLEIEKKPSRSARCI
jgi:poly(A) polymerase